MLYGILCSMEKYCKETKILLSINPRIYTLSANEQRSPKIPKTL